MPVRPRHAAWNRRAGFWRQWTLWIYFPLALFLVLAGVCLYRSGHWLVAGDAFDKVSWAVVLSGESRDGERSDAAVKLYLEGRIDTAIISSVRAYKDRYSGELVTGYMAAEGYPREKLFEFRHDAYSTQEEAALLIRQFRYQNLDTVVIITSNYHSARTRRIFRKLSQGYPQVLVYPAELKDYEPSAWWSGRESRKYWLIEWMKTVSTFFELLNAPPETGKSETDGLTGGITGGAADTFSAPPLPAPDLHPAPADSVPDSSAAPGDTGTLAPSEGRDSARSAAADTVSKPQAADSAAATKEAKEVKEAKEAKETSANKETVRKETKEVKSGAKEAPASKPTGSKAASKPASRKPPEKSKKKTTK